METTLNVIPCKNCLMLALCRHKMYLLLFKDCNLIKEYIPKFDHTSLRDVDRVSELQDTLRPSKWKFGGKYSIFDPFCALVESKLDSDIPYELTECNIVGNTRL